MARIIVWLLQIMCLTVLLLILVDLADLCVDKWKIGPPPVPLDVEGLLRRILTLQVGLMNNLEDEALGHPRGADERCEATSHRASLASGRLRPKSLSLFRSPVTLDLMISAGPDCASDRM